MSSSAPFLVADSPSPQEAINEWRKHAPKMSVYNAAPEWFVCEYDGNAYYFPPDLGVEGAMAAHPVLIERHPDGEPVVDAEGNFIPIMVKADGICMIGDLFGWTYDRFGRKEGINQIAGNQGFHIVIFMQRAHGYRGLVWLRGEPKDEARKANAKLLWRQHMRQWAVGEVQTFQTTVANWRARPGHKATPPPRPTDAQVKAQEFLDTYQETEADVYSCVVCLGFNSKQWDKFAFHMKRAHRVEVDEKEYGRLQAKVDARQRQRADDPENETAAAIRSGALDVLDPDDEIEALKEQVAGLSDKLAEAIEAMRTGAKSGRPQVDPRKRGKK